MTDELKPLLPCPCCNGTPSLMYGPGGDIWVKCPVCGLQTEMHPNNAAITAWNRRAEPDGLPEWLREKIQGSIHNAYECLDRSAPLNNKRSNRNWSVLIDALEWVLSLRREDAE